MPASGDSGRKVASQAGEDDVGTVPGGDDQQILLKVVHKIADLHSRDKVVVNKVVQAFIAEKHVGVHPFLDFTDARIAQGGGFADEEQRSESSGAFNDRTRTGGQSSWVNDTRLTNTQPTSRRLSFSNSGYF